MEFFSNSLLCLRTSNKLAVSYTPIKFWVIVELSQTECYQTHLAPLKWMEYSILLFVHYLNRPLFLLIYSHMQLDFCGYISHKSIRNQFNFTSQIYSRANYLVINLLTLSKTLLFTWRWLVNQISASNYVLISGIYSIILLLNC